MKKDMKKEDKNSSLLIILLQKLRKRVQSAPITTTGTITPADLQLKTVDEVINYYESLKTGNILDKILNKKRSLVNTDFSFRTRDNIDNELRTEAALQFQASLNTTQKKEYRLLNIYGGAGIGKTRYGSEAVKILQKTKEREWESFGLVPEKAAEFCEILQQTPQHICFDFFKWR